MKTRFTLFALLLCLCGFMLLFLIRYSKTGPPGTLLHRRRTLQTSHLYQPTIWPTKCADGNKVVLIVTSYVGHAKLRSAHRQAMPKKYLDQFNTHRVFLLAQIPHHERDVTQKAIEDENLQHGDIVQGSFIEHYRNLTYKHLMGLNWAATECSNADFVIKLDDDTVFNYEAIHHYLKRYDLNSDLMVGYVLKKSKPHRDRQNKWYVSLDEYSQPVYPDYLSGWLYITTPSTASKLVYASSYHPYFWIEDIFITGILTQDLGIKLEDMKSENIWLEYYELMECCLKDMIEKNIKCEYAVAPNGGRYNLILDFIEAMRKCESLPNCKKSDRVLKDKCVVESERTVFGDGQSQVRMIHL